MIKNIFLLILVSATVFNEGKADRTNENQVSGVQTKERRNRDKLSRIVQVLNGDIPLEDNNYERRNEGAKYPMKKQTFVKMLQKMYPKEFDIRNTGTDVRIHYIKNPDVLDDYVKSLRRKDTSSSSSDSSDSSDEDRRRGNKRGDVRRNAIFRIHDRAATHEVKEDAVQKADNNDEVITNSPKNYPPSIEDQVTPFKPHYLESNEKKDKEKDENVQFDANTKRFKIQSKSEQDKTTKEPWDKYESDKSTKEGWDTKDKYDWKKKQDDDVKKKSNDYAWDAKDDEFKTDKHVNRDDGSEKIKRKSVRDSEEKPRNKKKSVKVQRKRKDLWESKEVDRKKKKHETYDDDASKKKTKGWEEPRLPRKKDVDNDWDRVGREWGKKESRGPVKAVRESWKPRKKNPDDEYSKPSYVARIPEYHKSKGREGGGVFQGRTSIPRVGKRGIYDDK